MKKMDDLLSRIESGEYEIKPAWRPTGRSLTLVFPITTRKTRPRDYITLEEVKDKVEIIDTGDINKIQVKSNIDKPLFIRGGTMLKGTTQERATQYGIIVTPKRKMFVKVHCIHATKGIVSGAKFHPHGHIPHGIYSVMLIGKSQALTWRAINHFAQKLQANLSSRIQTDNLIELYENLQRFRKDLKEILKEIPDYINQVGVVLVDPDGIVGFELYDHPASWKAFSESIIKSFAQALEKQDKTGIFTPDLDAAKRTIYLFLKEIRTAKEETVYKTKIAETRIIKTEHYVGGYTKLHGKTIHITITRKTAPPLKEEKILFPQSWLPQRQSRRPAFPEVRYPLYYRLATPKLEKKLDPLLNALTKPKTWTQLKNELPLAKATLSARIKFLQHLGLVEKRRFPNGKTRYQLTALGKTIKKQK